MSYAREPDAVSEIPEPQPWRRNVVLFLLTVMSVLATSTLESGSFETPPGSSYVQTLRIAFATRPAVVYGVQFTVSLLAILLAHEFGHYIAARIHKVDASLPYFIPMPFSPFGTMGAIIRMRGQIPTRRALLDIGASGPLAGLCLAIPIYYYGAAHSRVIAAPNGPGELGESLLVKLLDHLAVPGVAEGQTLMLSSFAFAAWGGMFVTMINLLPVGQLDGGHVAYALFGKRQDAFGRNLHRGVFVFYLASLVVKGALLLHSTGTLATFASVVRGSNFWMTWFQMLAVIGTISRQERTERYLALRIRLALTVGLIALPEMATGAFAWAVWAAFGGVLIAMIWLEITRGAFRKHNLLNHPEVSDERLDPVRSVVAVVTLLFLVALFMPTPFSM